MLMQQGRALVDEGHVETGIEKYQQALKIAPTNPTVHNLMGLAELKRNDPTAALQCFNRALVLAPSYSDARNNRAAAYLAMGQSSQAEADFLHVLSDRMYANRPGVYFNLGSLYFSQGNLAAAEENLRKAAVPSGPVEAYLMLGRVEDRLGNAEEAEATWRAAMVRAPERPEFPLALADLLAKQGKREEARELLERILTLAPSSPEAREARARLGR